MISRWTALGTSAAILSVLLAGCAGAGLIAAIIGLLAAGDIVSDVSDLIHGGDDPGEFVVLLDGQVLPVVPDADGNLALRNLPEGNHLLQLVSPDKNRGGVTMIDVEPNRLINIGNPPEIVGGRIVGRVRLGATGIYNPARRVLVVAISDGAPAVQEGRATPITIPPTDQVYFAAYTDANGNYEINAVEVGDHLVTAAVAGYQSDVKLVHVDAGTAPTANLDLERDVSMPSGVLSGRVSGQMPGGTQAVAGASIHAAPATPFEPIIRQDAIDAIAAASGLDLADSPWFSWTWLGVVTDAGGGYQGRAAIGDNRLTCFGYGYKPVYQDIQMVNDGSAHGEFLLQP